MSGSGVDTLTEMGFLRNRAEKAWAIVGDKGVEAAMEWLLQHNEDPDIDEPYQPPQGHSLKSEESTDCLKEGGNVVETSASQNPVEKKELSPEEKAKQVQMLQDKMNQRREEKEEVERKRAIEMEKSRRKDGQDLSKIRTEIQWKEAQRQADIRRREKREDALARQRVKDQIARDRADKKAQEEKSKMEKKEQLASPQPAKSITAATTQHTHARLQIRLPNSTQMVQKFTANEELSAVRLYIELNRKDGCNEPFSLMTAFPKKIFTDEDYGKSLQMLGLTPSSVLIVTKER